MGLKIGLLYPLQEGTPPQRDAQSMSLDVI